MTAMRFLRGKTGVVAGSLAVALVFAFGAFRPDMGKINQLRRDTGTLRATVDTRSTRLETAPATRHAHDELTAKLAGFDEAVPPDQRIGAFLESLDQIAREVGLSGKSVKPADTVVCTQVNCMPIDVNVTGRFAALHEFLHRVESMPRIARVQRLELAGAEDLPDELVASVTLHVYFRPS